MMKALNQRSPRRTPPEGWDDAPKKTRNMNVSIHAKCVCTVKPPGGSFLGSGDFCLRT
jgi:hypothetical protein